MLRNFAVHLPCGQIDEFRRQIGNERLEAQAVFEFGTQGGVFRVHRMVASPRRREIATPLLLFPCRDIIVSCGRVEPSAKTPGPTSATEAWFSWGTGGAGRHAGMKSRLVRLESQRLGYLHFSVSTCAGINHRQCAHRASIPLPAPSGLGRLPHKPR
jgi:hypothetical protein